ncbi:restriction endonuclease subunit S [Vibrio parahaemolyticus]|uniref:restriction endonuclease subunit S n=1 Tax=Vibrio parahaemolyticus TaxID=670 RepID=UPI003B66E238
MGKYQAYPECKDSGVEWLENIPSHWNTKPLKHLCSFNDDVLAENTKKDYELCYVDIGSVSATDGISRVETMTYGSAPSRARRLVRDGDVIVSTVRTYLEAIAPINNPPSNMVVSTGFAVIRPNNKLYKGYAAYCLRANGFIKEVVARSVGVSYPAINASELVGIAVPSLPIEEQTQIANFLDHETAKIDTLIEKQQQLIKLLKEKRQAVISHAVTKGLNPHAPMKDSGVEWLGEVPEHWVVAGFKKYLASIVDYRGKTPNKVESGRFLVTARNIKKGKINYLSSTEYVSEADYAQVMSRGIPNIGDVLFTTEAPLGEVAQVDNSDIALAQRVIKFCGQSGVLDNTYLKYFIMSDSFQDSLMTYASGSTALGIKAERLVYLRQLLPPLSEQRQIISHIEAVATKIDLLEQKAIAAIDLMQERRTALISAAVTGKIDVRNWQAPTSQNQSA